MGAQGDREIGARAEDYMNNARPPNAPPTIRAAAAAGGPRSAAFRVNVEFHAEYGNTEPDGTGGGEEVGMYDGTKVPTT